MWFAGRGGAICGSPISAVACSCRRRTGPVAAALAANVLICYSGNGTEMKKILMTLLCVCLFMCFRDHTYRINNSASLHAMADLLWAIKPWFGVISLLGACSFGSGGSNHFSTMML